jgi:hypothetical protein
MLDFVGVIPVDKAGQSRTMAVDINIHEKSVIGLLIKLGELALLIVSVFVIIYQ